MILRFPVQVDSDGNNETSFIMIAQNVIETDSNKYPEIAEDIKKSARALATVLDRCTSDLFVEELIKELKDLQDLSKDDRITLLNHRLSNYLIGGDIR